MIKSILFAVVLITAVLFFLYSIKNFLSYIKLGKTENRLNNIKQRLINTLNIAFLQTKLFRSRLAGFLHFCIYWGFLVLSIVILESIFEGFFPNFSFHFIGRLYSVLTLTQDFFGALVFLVVLFSLARRYIATPKRLKVAAASRNDAVFILLMILFIMITMFGANAERILLGSSYGFRPVSYFIAKLIGGSGSHTIYEINWWAHIVIVLAFFFAAQYSKRNTCTVHYLCK